MISYTMLLTMIFQSTLPYGSDFMLMCLNLVTIWISIHAPLRERLPCYGVSYIQANFNPRSLTGATYGPIYTSTIRLFQSTLPYGSDQPSLADQTFAEISIHAPLRERLKLMLAVVHVILFQSTLPYGSDTSLCNRVNIHHNFNPRSLTGATEGAT